MVRYAEAMSSNAIQLSLPTLLEVRATLAAILPQTGWLPPSGPFRVLNRLNPIHVNPDTRPAIDGDDRAQAYLRQQVARSDWERWRADSDTRTGPFATAPWRWTLGDVLHRALVLDAYPTDGSAHILMVEIPLISLDRRDVVLRVQAHAPDTVEDHEWRYGRREEASWTRLM